MCFVQTKMHQIMNLPLNKGANRRTFDRDRGDNILLLLCNAFSLLRRDLVSWRAVSRFLEKVNLLQCLSPSIGKVNKLPPLLPKTEHRTGVLNEFVQGGVFSRPHIKRSSFFLVFEKLPKRTVEFQLSSLY